jgi:hypothetical protein
MQKEKPRFEVIPNWSRAQTGMNLNFRGGSVKLLVRARAVLVASNIAVGGFRAVGP